MDNLEGKFKSYDAVRRQESANEYRLSEVKNKLLYNAERALRPHLSKMAGRVLSTRVDSLEITEDAESGSPIFTGKVIAEVAFFDGKQEKRASIPVSILHSQPEVITKDLREALEKATVAEEVTASTATPTSITASLEDFKVVDDGTRYLKIYHTAAYGDLEPIGAISKEEYVTASNKSDLLSEMLKDEAVAWPADVTFIGKFVEPSIVEASVPADTQYVVHAHDQETEVEAEPNTYQYKVTDANRLALEAEQKRMDDLTERISARARAAFMDAWKSRGTGMCNIKNTSNKYDVASGVGEITIEAEVLDGKDVKLVPFIVSVNGANMRLPDFTNLAALLKEAKVVTNEIQGENIHKNIVIEKKAAPMAPSKQNYQEVLRLPKDFLPASLKEGDVIAVDGLRYKLTSKSEGQLSNQRDTASHWLFERVHGDEKPIYRQENY